MDHDFATSRRSNQAHVRMHQPPGPWLVGCVRACAAIILCLQVGESLADPNGIQAAFDDAYREWVIAVTTTSEVPQMFTASFTSARPEFKRMTGLGIKAAPCLVEKIRESPADRARVLLSAFIDVTKKRFGAEDIGWAKERGLDLTHFYLNWWEGAVEDTSNKFATLSREMEMADTDGNSEATLAAAKRIVDLGVLVLPHAMEKVRGGDTNMVPVVSALTDGAVRKDAPVYECVQWWTSNKMHWVLNE